MSSRHFAFSLLFAGLAAAFVAVLVLDRPLYNSMLVEDGPVETATGVVLLAAMILFALAAGQHPADGKTRYFLAGFAVLLFLAAMDEISWGQRLFQIPSPQFFLEHNDQQEINIHNSLQRFVPVTAKHAVGLGMVLYGVVIPWLLRRGALTPLRLEEYLLFPPSFLALPIVVGALFMADFPTGREEEIGELLLSLCLCLFGDHEAASGAAPA